MALADARTQVDTALTRESLRGMSNENTFAGITSFLRRRYTKDLSGVDVAVTGIPYDQSVTNRPGARFGPRAIREASALQAPDAPYGWGFNPMTEFAIADYGDMAFDYAVPADVPAAIEAHIGGILDQDTGCIALGGDHSISLPCLRSHVARLGGPVALVQFDAHTDTWVNDDPARIDHGTMFHTAVREGLIDVKRSVQTGIRTENPDTLGITVIDAQEVHRAGPEKTADRILEIVDGAVAYVSFDIDALDPGFAPGTGTPVWGGLASWQAAALLRGLAGLRVAGGDVVEVSPPFDPSGATAIAGAHVALELICLWCWARR